MRYARSILLWLLFVGCIMAIGVGVFGYLRTQPRCVLETSWCAWSLSPDGMRVLTGEWEVFDTHSGVKLFSLPSDGQQCVFSKDGRHIAIRSEDGRVGLIDWQTGDVWRYDNPLPNDPEGFLEFSRRGRWLFVHAMTGKECVVIDVATRRITRRLAGAVSGIGPHEVSGISPDERFVLLKKGENDVVVWDLDHDRQHGELPLQLSQWQISPDGRFVADYRWSEKREEHGIDVWDVTALRRVFRHKIPLNRYVATFSPDGGRLAVCSCVDWRKKIWQVEMLDTMDGKVVGPAPNLPMRHVYDVDSLSRDGTAFSPDGKLLFVKGNGCVAMVDGISGALLWMGNNWGRTYFADGAAIVTYQIDPNGLADFVDARSGQFKAAIPVTFFDDTLRATPDGRYCVIPGNCYRKPNRGICAVWLEKMLPAFNDPKTTCVVVMETSTWREALRVVGCGDSACLSADGGTLVTSQNLGGDWNGTPPGPFVLRVWDVHSAKAWLWAIGIALGSGLAWHSILFVWRRLRKRKTATASGVASALLG